MNAKEIMTSDTKYCGPETKVHEAAKTMQAANCGVLPVLDEEKRVVGIITDRDICLSLALDQGKSGAEGRVKDIMSAHVHTVEANDDMASLLNTMQTNKIGRLPVTDKQGKLEGMISLHNIVNHSNNEKVSDKIHESDILKTIKALSSRYSERPKASKTLIS